MELPPKQFFAVNVAEKQSGEYIGPAPLIGILIGALAGGICFVAFGLMRAGYVGGFSMIYLLNKVKGRPIEQSPLVRIMAAAGIIVSIVLGLAVSMVLGGIVGGVLAYVLMEMT